MLPTKSLDQLPPFGNSSQTSVDPIQQRLQQIQRENRVGCGWLRYTCSVYYLTYWKKRICEYFHCEIRSRGKGWNGYIESLQGGLGIIIAFTPKLTEKERQELGVKASPNEGYMTVDIPQSALDSLSGLNLFKLWIDVYGCDGLKFTRVDLYYDDYCKVISPEAVHNSCKMGGVAVPRFESMRGFDNYDLQMGRSVGYTVYFGSVKSEKKVRFYDKAQESDGKQNCYRWEIELTGQYAESFGSHFLGVLSDAMDHPALSDSINAIGNAYKALIKGAVTFHEVPIGVHPKDLPKNWAARSPVVWWWDELLAGLEPAKLVLDRVPPSLASAVSWIKSQVAPSLAVIRTVFQNWSIPFTTWLHSLLEESEDRWSDRHWQMIADALITSPAT